MWRRILSLDHHCVTSILYVRRNHLKLLGSILIYQAINELNIQEIYWEICTKQDNFVQQNNLKFSLSHKLLFYWCRHQESNSRPSDYKTYPKITDQYKSTTYNVCQAQKLCHTVSISGVWHKFDTIKLRPFWTLKSLYPWSSASLHTSDNCFSNSGNAVFTVSQTMSRSISK